MYLQLLYYAQKANVLFYKYIIKRIYSISAEAYQHIHIRQYQVSPYHFYSFITTHQLYSVPPFFFIMTVN